MSDNVLSNITVGYSISPMCMCVKEGFCTGNHDTSRGLVDTSRDLAFFCHLQSTRRTTNLSHHIKKISKISLLCVVLIYILPLPPSNGGCTLVERTGAAWRTPGAGAVAVGAGAGAGAAGAGGGAMAAPFGAGGRRFPLKICCKAASIGWAIAMGGRCPKAGIGTGADLGLHPSAVKPVACPWLPVFPPVGGTGAPPKDPWDHPCGIMAHHDFKSWGGANGQFIDQIKLKI